MLCRFFLVISVVVLQIFSWETVPVLAAGEQLSLVPGDESVGSNKPLNIQSSFDVQDKILRNFDIDDAVFAKLIKVCHFSSKVNTTFSIDYCSCNS